MAGEAEIAALDAALARAGEDVVLRRVVKRSSVLVDADVTCRAAVRAVSAEQIVGRVTERSMTVILSPTQILAEGWPGVDEAVISSTIDQSLPKETDKAVVQGREREILTSKPVYVGGAWVRHEMVVQG
jgi:hypothetical protein